MNRQIKHESFCFAGQPAPCTGYFADDVLPCICGAEGDVITALSELALPAPVCEKVVEPAPPKSAQTAPQEWIPSWNRQERNQGKRRESSYYDHR